jgi:DNA-binding NarL/FixJ family response regulator
LVAVNDVFLDGVVEWVADDPRIEVVGRAHTGAQALESVGSLRAEMVLVDVTLPDMSGFEVARRIKSRPGAPLVVMLSFHDSHAARLEAWAAGADGFVAKSETADCLKPLVGDLLRQRHEGVREVSTGISTLRVPQKEVSE